MGVFTDDVTENFIEWVEKQMKSDGEIKKSSIRKASFLLAETYQNIVRHQLPTYVETGIEELIEYPDGFQARIHDGCLQIASSNKIKNEDVPHLSEALKEVAVMSKEELKELWFKRMTNSGYTKNGGAGLGLIEISRKIDQPIDYSFEQLDDEHQLFCMTINFRISAEETGEKVDHNTFNKLYEQQVQNGAIMAFKGLINPETSKVILSILGSHFDATEPNELIRKKNLQTAEKSLSNFNSLGLDEGGQTQGYFGFGKKDNKHFLYYGFFLNENNVLDFGNGNNGLQYRYKGSEMEFYHKNDIKFKYSISDTKFGKKFIDYKVYLPE